MATNQPDKSSDEHRRIKVSSSASETENGDNPIQVPSTAPVEPSKSTQTSQPSLQDEGQGQHADELEVTDVDEEDEEASDGDLAPFDWEELRARYTHEIGEISKQEDDILAEFDVFVEGFGIWAEAGAEHDNERAMKRLKTRERYVQIAESSLEEKKNHYIQVVDAFKKALELLKR